MLSPSPASIAVVVDSGSRRRRRRSAAAPAAPTACSAPTAALASCFAALLLNTATGVDSSPASATATVARGCYASLPRPCFLHAATAPNRDRARYRTRGGGSGTCGVTPVSKLSLTGPSASGSGGSGVNGSRFYSRRRRARSRLAAWGGGGDGDGAGLSVGLGAGQREAAATRGVGGSFRQGGAKRARAGVRSQSWTAEVQASGLGGPGASSTMEAAYATAGREGAGAASADGAPGSTALPDLSKMKLPELKELYRAAGGKPGALRKAELVERLNESQEARTVTAPAAAASSPASATDPLLFEAEGTAQAVPTTLEEAENSSSSLFSVLAGRGGMIGDGAAGDHDLAASSAPLEEDTHAAVPDPPALASPAAWSGEAAGVAGDVLSIGPSAVVAAARARGAAAAAASSKVAAGGRLRAMAEARRHTEAVRARVSKTAWSQNGAGDVKLQGQQQQQQQQPQNHRDDGTGAASRATVAFEGAEGPSGGGRNTMAVKGPGAAAVAAVAAAAAAARAAAGAASSSTPGYANRDPSRGRDVRGGRKDGRRQAATPASRGNEGGGGRGVRGADGGAWSVLADPNLPRRSSHSPRQRRLPALQNPWARGGLGAAAEGMAEEGDVVDAFLADTMVQTTEDREASGDPLFDRESRLGVYAAGAPMQLTFLGTASCIPSTSRGVSCTVLRNEGDLWLFDVGEGTQIQIQKSSLKPTRITKIFITHAHGDHSFGLPGLLCLMGTNFDRTEGNRVEIYGPTGLRAYLRAAIQYTYSKAVAPYVVHELMDVPFLHGDFCSQPEPFQVNIAQNTRYGEQNGGRNFYPNKDGHFELFQDQKVTVRAAPMKHGIPCVGFAVEETDRPGRLKVEELKPILEEHKQAITEATGKKDVGWLLGWIKSTKRGETITLPGTNIAINSADYVGAPVKGRKVVILGDTCDAGSMVPLAIGADVVIHEATNTLLPPLDQGKTYASVEADAIKHGHSTPVMAAAFAQKVGAKTLILNHFSARYKGDPSDSSVAAMLRIERQAARAGDLERHQVMASWDLLELPVVDGNQWEANRKIARAADAAFNAELLRRAEQWHQRQQEQQEAEAAALEANSRPRKDLYGHEHERSRNIPKDADVVQPRDSEEQPSEGATSYVTGPLDGRGSSSSSSSSQGGEVGGGAKKVNGSSVAAAATNTGLVGIMYDTVAK